MIAAGSILPIAPAPFELLVTSFARSAAADLHSLRNQKLPPFRSAVGQFSMIASGSVFHDRSQFSCSVRCASALINRSSSACSFGSIG
jgi:hypothetical protein